MNYVAMPLPNEGYFFARAETVGTCEQEIDASQQGKIPVERVGTIAQNMIVAKECLEQAATEGRC